MNVYSRVSNYRLDNVFIIPTRFALVNVLILIYIHTHTYSVDNYGFREMKQLFYRIK